MQVRLRILRYDPERDPKPHWEEYTVEAEPTEPLLDLLHTVKWHHDGSLTFRRSCAHGVCGSDAMLINGRNRLACKIRVDQLGRKISIAPLPGLKVIKDLVVDMDEFFAKYRSVMPFQIDDGVMPARERRQSQADRERYDDTTKCILCAACTSSCPSFWAQDSYVGPAAIVNAHRFIFDTRDAGCGRAAGDPVRRGRRLALPDHLQLHRCLPPGHQHHARHPGGLVGHHGAWGLNLLGPVDGSGLGRIRTTRRDAAAAPVRATRHPDRRCVTRQPRPGIGGRGAHRRLPTRCVRARRDGRRGRRPRPGHPHQQRGGVRGPGAGAARGGAAGRAGDRPAARLQAHRGAAERSLAGQGRQAPGPLRGGDPAPEGRSGAGPRSTSRGPATRPRMPSPTWPSTTRWARSGSSPRCAAGPTRADRRSVRGRAPGRAAPPRSSGCPGVVS